MLIFCLLPTCETKHIEQIKKETQVSKQIYNSTSLNCLGIITTRLLFVFFFNSRSVSLPLTTLLRTYKKDKLIYLLEMFMLPEREKYTPGGSSKPQT